MRILVTGGCGFIGSHVVEQLVHAGNQVTVIDNLSTGKAENLDGITARNKLEIRYGDVKAIQTLRGAFDETRPDAVIHLAAQAAISTSQKMPYLDGQVNALGTLNVLRLAADYGARKIVFSSTSAVYAQKFWGKYRETDNLAPDSPYGISKMCAEMYLRTLFKNSTILRFGNVFGPRQVPLGENQVIARIISHFLKGTEFKIFGDGKQTRDFVYVKDVADAVIHAIHGNRGTFNVGSGRETSVMDLARIMEKIYDVRGYPWEHSGPRDARRRMCLNVSAAASELAWKAKTPFDAAVRETVNWWEAHNGR